LPRTREVGGFREKLVVCSMRLLMHSPPFPGRVVSILDGSAAGWLFCACAALSVFLGSSAKAGQELQPVESAPVVPVGTGQGQRPHVLVYDLERCLELASQNYPRVSEARARLRRVRGQLSEARTAPFGEFKATGLVGVIPTLRGTTIYSPDSDITVDDHLSPMYRFTLQGVVPVWTFGKIDGVREAAKAQVELTREELRKARLEVMMMVREAFYGFQFARDALALVRDAAQEVDKYVADLEPRVRRGDADESDLFELRLQRSELEARESEALGRLAVARSSLRFLIGASGDIDIPDEPLAELSEPLRALSSYVAEARSSRPELGMARAGVRARRAQVEQQKAGYYPNLGIGLSVDVAHAGSVADQRNPFSYDPVNFARYGGALVLDWKLDFLPQAARVDQAEARLAEVRATERYAEGGVVVEVERAFYEAEAARRRVKTYEAAVKLARKWLITTQQGIEIGAYEPKDLTDPAKEYALRRFAHMNAVYDYNIALSRLALATGRR